MATYIMKIRPHFIDCIRRGQKTHEYRLGEPRRTNVKKGDTIILVSNQDPEDYVRVFVDNVTVYEGWDEAFKGRWEKDFEGIYSSYEDLIKECHKFYTADQVRQYGIVVFDVHTDQIDYKGKRYLVDTNIIIHRESHDAAIPLVGKLYNWLDRMSGKKFYHPQSKNEISKYADKKVVDSFEGKLNAYEELTPIENGDSFFDAIIRGENEDENSRIDNELLLQVFKGRADFLLTDDKGILRKAQKLYLRERVLTPADFVHIMEKRHPALIDYDVLSVQKEKIGTIPVEDQFFDTLREDYGHPEFNSWLNRKSEEDAYTFRDKNGVLEGFLYLKAEHKDESFKGFDKKMKEQEWLKVGTFKNATKGLRVGERFLKIIFDNALKMNVDGIYVTLFENKRDSVKRLMNLMEKWGFVPYCHNENGELVMIKNMRQYDFSKDPMFNYPLRKELHNYFFLPIEPEWHGKLFPDLHIKNEHMSIYEGEACSYAVEKIYVCGAKRVNAKPGDLAFVYRKGEYIPKKYHSVITGTAILQQVIYPNNEEQFLETVKNKSVFSLKELKSFYENDQYRTIVKVLFLKPFERKVTLSKLSEWGIVDQFSGPRINTPITLDQAHEILKEGERK